MASTTKIWKELFIYEFEPKWLNWFGLLDQKYEVLFKQKLSDDNETTWFNAYVKFEKVNEKYEFEGYRMNNIIGCDTSDQTSKSEHEQLSILHDRITKTIEEHHNKYNI